MSASPRYVVFDQETTGLNPERDRIISIGAVAVIDEEIVLTDVFEAVIRVPLVTSAVVIHGITPQESSRGREESEAVGAFLDYIGEAVLVGHHVGFDRSILQTAAVKLGRSLPNPALDTMRIALALKDAGKLDFDAQAGFDLDVLCARFQIAPHDRHTSPGDAFLTAQIFVRLLRYCRKAGMEILALAETQ